MSFKTLLRAGVGAGFMAHGAQKLFGWFGGHGLDATGQFFESNLQMAPGKRNATAAGLSEFGGGALLATGLATPVATTTLTSTMLTAIWKVHKDKGFFAGDGGWELNGLLIVALLAIAEEESGPLAAALTLVGGAVGSYAAIELGRREYAKRHADDAADGGSPNGGPVSDQAAVEEPASTSA
jgi:putative oxidoreductase